VRFVAWLLLLGWVWLGAGCFSMRVVAGNDVPADRISQIQPGQTTKAEILYWFGAPEDYTDPSGLRRIFADGVAAPEDVLALPYADVLVYEEAHARVKGLLLFLFNWFDVHVVQDRLVVFFDDQDRVLYYGYQKGSDAVE
jgi:hypothetical protein